MFKLINTFEQNENKHYEQLKKGVDRCEDDSLDFVLSKKNKINFVENKSFVVWQRLAEVRSGEGLLSWINIPRMSAALVKKSQLPWNVKTVRKIYFAPSMRKQHGWERNTEVNSLHEMQK